MMPHVIITVITIVIIEKITLANICYTQPEPIKSAAVLDDAQFCIQTILQ